MILVLAGSYARAVDYCVREGLHRSAVRIVTQAEKLRGTPIRPGDDVRILGGTGTAWRDLMDIYECLSRIGGLQ
jgi:hypothetical protein